MCLGGAFRPQPRLFVVQPDIEGNHMPSRIDL